MVEYVIFNADFEKMRKNRENGVEKEILENYDKNSIKEIMITVFMNENNESISVYFTEEGIKVFSGNILISTGISPKKMEFTTASKTLLKTENDIKGMRNLVFDITMDTIIIANTIKNGKVKEISSSFSSKIKIKEYGILAKKYTYEYGESNKIIEKDGRWKIMSLKEEIHNVYDLPSSLYPLVNDKDVRMYNYDNTEELEDNYELSKILSSLDIKLGDCYNNTMLIQKALKECGYDKKHTVERKVGWIKTEVDPHFHSWLVIDEKYIIDPNMSDVRGYIENGIKNMKLGEGVFNWDRQEAVKIYKASLSKPYHERGLYGRAKKECIYIGSTVNDKEEQEFIRNFMKKYPDHKAFRGIDKNTGNNGLHDIARNIGL